MAFKVISEPKQPTSEDIAKGRDHWVRQQTLAIEKLQQAEDGRARRRYMERIAFCRMAAHQAHY